MNAALKPTPVSPPRKRRMGPRRSYAFVQEAVECMARVRGGLGRCVFAVVAPNRGAGTSHVVNVLAEELAWQFDASIAVVPTEALQGCDPRRLPQGFTEKSPNLWTAVPDETLHGMPDASLSNVWISAGAYSFDFVLIDCPALDVNPVGLRWAEQADGVLLVVEAGVTPVERIEAAERLLQGSTSRLAGMILNRRTYPIPKFLYRLL